MNKNVKNFCNQIILARKTLTSDLHLAIFASKFQSEMGNNLVRPDSSTGGRWCSLLLGVMSICGLRFRP